MDECANVVVRVERIGMDVFLTQMQLRLPPSEVAVDFKFAPVKLAIDLRAFESAATDDAYGGLLGHLLFGDVGIRTYFTQARLAADSADKPLRVRLLLAQSAQDLHVLHWEKLIFPGEGMPLFAEPRVFFSRYIESASFRPVYLRRRDELRALVVVSSPGDAAEYGLAQLDRAQEVEAVRTALAPIPVETLEPGGATLKSIMSKLGERYDVLHLVCHGAMGPSGPRLLLEQDNGTADLVTGDDLARELRNLEHPPRLVVLASCQSAGQAGAGRTGDVMSAIGPQLATDGTPAVIAMVGSVQVTTAAVFTTAFFRELSQDGVIDRAASVARDTVRAGGAPDWWMPVLFMRLENGRIGWYRPGFGRDDRQQQIRWNALVASLRTNRCTPILGLGLQESLVGPRRRIARRWADDRKFPVTPRDRESFTQVAQYLRVADGAQAVQIALEAELRNELVSAFGKELNAAGVREGESVWKMLAAAGTIQRQRATNEPHVALAQADVDVFITADSSTLLVDALVERGKKPRVEFTRWREDLLDIPLLRDAEPTYTPSPAEPLVYHLFGIADEPASLVLTEDNYFDFLIGITKYRDAVPPKVLRSLTQKNLLFLGFHLEDWAFRTIYRIILSLGGTHLLLQNVNVAAQVELESERVASQQEAREFLESAFAEANLNVFWGHIGDFIGELNRQQVPAGNPMIKPT